MQLEHAKALALRKLGQPGLRVSPLDLFFVGSAGSLDTFCACPLGLSLSTKPIQEFLPSFLGQLFYSSQTFLNKFLALYQPLSLNLQFKELCFRRACFLRVGIVFTSLLYSLLKAILLVAEGRLKLPSTVQFKENNILDVCKFSFHILQSSV